jgi:preprotein translocase subunit YajC
VIIYLLVFVVIAFMLWTTYSQQRRSKKAQEQLQRMVKKGDEVLTVGGMFGTVRKVGDDFVILEVADRTKVRFLRRAIREIVNEEEDVEEDDEAEYVDDEYDEAEYDEQDGDDEVSDDEDSDDEDSDDEADESDEAEEEDDGQELSAGTTDDAVDAPADSVRAPEPPTPPKGS